ncbi:MAG: amidohydrolase family protein [Pseudomonadota bacterium]
MAYAHRDIIYDADTHMMERPDWIAEFADPDIRPRLAPFLEGKEDVLPRVEDALEQFKARQADPAMAAEAAERFMGWDHKGWHGLGSFDAAERVRVNDLLGFSGHIVFPTTAFEQVCAAKEPEVFVGGVRALNRGLDAFCGVDKRMYGAAYLPLGLGPDASAELLDEIVAAGFSVVLVDTVAPDGGKSFTHPDYDPIWSRLEGERIAVTLHVGANGGYTPVPASFYDNARETPPPDEGDAPRDALGFMAIQYNAELFLSAMIFDGVLEKFPKLKIGVVELSAEWMISWIKRLDMSWRSFRRRQDLSHLSMAPSDYVTRQIKATPFPGEDIGWILRSGGEDLLMFASDYPHHEGTDDPIGRYERTMDGVSEAAKQKFYCDNFRDLLGPRLSA